MIHPNDKADRTKGRGTTFFNNNESDKQEFSKGLPDKPFLFRWITN